MRPLATLTALTLLASAANAQDTTVVVVRHIQPAQDTTVSVRHLGTQADTAARAVPPRRVFVPYAPRYVLRRNVIPVKDPYLGTSLSFLFPGGGQYYAGNTGKGFMLTLLGIGAPVVGYANVTRDRPIINGVGTPPPGYYNCSANGSGFFRGCGYRYDWTPAAIGLTVGIGAWLYGIATAGTDVQRWNRAHGVTFVQGPGRMGFAVPIP
jgi:hypothetical protein